MNVPTVTFVLGTRPEAIKLAPLISEFKKAKIFRVRLVLTGQHKEMVSQVMDFFNLIIYIHYFNCLCHHVLIKVQSILFSLINAAL